MESKSGRAFRTLLFGAYQGKNLKWIGHAGGGYKDHELPEILKRLKAIEIETSPFTNQVDYDGLAHWVKPDLVANIRYASFTKAGKIRKPAVFQGFREDKQARQVIVENAASAKIPQTKNVAGENKIGTSADSNWPQVEAQPVRNKQEVEVDGYSLTLTNVDYELWKGITKAELIQYYISISSYILPHLKNRPLSLHVKLKGPHSPGLYIKDMEGRQPDCADIFTTERRHKKSGKRNVIDYVICNNAATLLYTINLGCIDVNPWTSRSDQPTIPDYIIIDLDPSDRDFSKAVESAKAAKQFFDEHKLTAFIKTSGKTGIHMYIPCSAFTFAQTRAIAENICSQVHSMLPGHTTTELT